MEDKENEHRNEEETDDANGVETKGEVVFHKSLTGMNPEAWDDTALIQAWDNAISDYMVSHSGEKRPFSKMDEKKTTKEKGKEKEKENERIKKIKQDLPPNVKRVLNTTIFKVGDECFAKFSEDGLWYEAKIDEILSGEEENTKIYKVTYNEYGNSEILSPSSLKVIEKKDDGFKLKKSTAFASKGKEVEDSEGNEGKDEKEKPKQEKKEDWPNYNYPGYPYNPYYGYSHDQMHPPVMNPDPRSSAQAFPTPSIPPFSYPGYPPAPSFPSIPPSPSFHQEDEDFANLLMSWYFTGYYTAIYHSRQRRWP